MHLECFGLDCMLRQRKSQLVRELWKASKSLREPNSEQLKTVAKGTDALDMKIKNTLNSILKRLDVDELELLLEAVKSKGRSHSHCVHLTEGPSGLNSHTTSCQDDSQPSPMAQQQTSHTSTLGTKDISSEAGQAVCKAWRWTDLAEHETLRPLPYCQIPVECRTGGSDCQSCLCINPYHWCKVLDVISDLKPNRCQVTLDGVYLRRKTDLDNNTDFTLTETTTDAEPWQTHWCQVAYWELTQRIGQLFPVTPSSIDIFQDIPQGCGVSLATLHKAHAAKTQSVAALRLKIGAGITLSNEGGLVWLYNRSQRDVFVTSFCLNVDKSSNETWRVCKVAPGHSIVIYDYRVLRSRLDTIDSLTGGSGGLTNPHSIHLSFVKGWSGSYSRQNVLSCECWLEILINERVFQSR